MQIDEQDVRPVFALTEKNFWLCKSLRRVLNIYLATILFEAYGFSKLFGSSQKTECLTQFSLHASVYDLRKVWSAGEKLPNRLLIKICAFPRGHVSTVRLLRQSKWTVPITGSVVEASDASPVSDFTDKKNSVKAMLIRYGRRGQSPGESLIMHMHGGGYIALSPKSHEGKRRHSLLLIINMYYIFVVILLVLFVKVHVHLYDHVCSRHTLSISKDITVITGCLRRWSQKLKVPVISIDYRLSPEHRYPCALQDALDSYLFLTSGSPEVVDKIGYHPKNIVVCGDSAGGNLCVALTYVLNDIRKKQAGISMPTAISVQFPATNFVIGCFSPSRILTAVDCFLGIGIGNACMAAYASTGPDEDRKTSIKTQRMPWYRGEVWQESVQKLQTNLNEVYFNLLAANFREMADIPLFVQACEFDPLLDDAIHIAKLWCGPVQVDVIENVMHGFLAFQDFSAEARRGGQICADRLAQALKLDSYTSESKS